MRCGVKQSMTHANLTAKLKRGIEIRDTETDNRLCETGQLTRDTRPPTDGNAQTGWNAGLDRWVIRNFQTRLAHNRKLTHKRGRHRMGEGIGSRAGTAWKGALAEFCEKGKQHDFWFRSSRALEAPENFITKKTSICTSIKGYTVLHTG